MHSLPPNCPISPTVGRALSVGGQAGTQATYM